MANRSSAWYLNETRSKQTSCVVPANGIVPDVGRPVCVGSGQQRGHGVDGCRRRPEAHAGAVEGGHLRLGPVEGEDEHQRRSERRGVLGPGEQDVDQERCTAELVGRIEQPPNGTELPVQPAELLRDGLEPVLLVALAAERANRLVAFDRLQHARGQHGVLGLDQLSQGFHATGHDTDDQRDAQHRRDRQRGQRGGDEQQQRDVDEQRARRDHDVQDDRQRVGGVPALGGQRVQQIARVPPFDRAEIGRQDVVGQAGADVVSHLPIEVGQDEAVQVVEDGLGQDRRQYAEADDHQTPLRRDAGKEPVEESDQKGGAGRAVRVRRDDLNERNEQRDADTLREGGEDAQDDARGHRPPVALEKRGQQADGSEFRRHARLPVRPGEHTRLAGEPCPRCCRQLRWTHHDPSAGSSLRLCSNQEEQGTCPHPSFRFPTTLGAGEEQVFRFLADRCAWDQVHVGLRRSRRRPPGPRHMRGRSAAGRFRPRNHDIGRRALYGFSTPKTGRAVCHAGRKPRWCPSL